MDINEEKILEELRESVLYFSQITENIDSAFWISENKKLLYLSSGGERLSGIPINQILDQPEKLLNVIHMEDRYRVLLAFQNAMKKPEALFNEEFRVVYNNDKVRWVSAKNSACTR